MGGGLGSRVRWRWWGRREILFELVEFGRLDPGFQNRIKLAGRFEIIFQSYYLSLGQVSLRVKIL